MQRASVAASGGITFTRVARALRHPGNWLQLAKFCVVGAVGYGVNLLVYKLLLDDAHLHYVVAATCSFLVAATNNYAWNRMWTFRRERGHVGYQGLRFLIVSLLAYGTNLGLLALLVEAAALGKFPAQAIAIVLVTPVNFVGNKLWSFRR